MEILTIETKTALNGFDFDLSDIDAKELHDQLGITDWSLIPQYLGGVQVFYAAVDNKKVIALYGVSPFEDFKQCGCPWLLVSKQARGNKFLIYKNLLKEFKRITNGYSFLFNYVAVENKTAQRLLCRLGFVIHKDEIKEVGADKQPYYKFTKQCAHQR